MALFAHIITKVSTIIHILTWQRDSSENLNYLRENSKYTTKINTTMCNASKLSNITIQINKLQKTHPKHLKHHKSGFLTFYYITVPPKNNCNRRAQLLTRVWISTYISDWLHDLTSSLSSISFNFPLFMTFHVLNRKVHENRPCTRKQTASVSEVNERKPAK